MNPDNQSAAAKTIYFIGILGSFLIVFALVWAIYRFAQPPTLGEDRASARRKTLVELRAAETQALNNYGWHDKSRGIVRLPIDEAIQLSLRYNQNPAAARSNLLARAAKAFAPAPQQPNPFE